MSRLSFNSNATRSTSLRHIFTIFSLFVVLLFVQSTNGQSRNVTVDDGDSAIEYEGFWQRSGEYNSMSAGGFHMVSWGDPNAKATFKFNGTALYLWFPSWPYRVVAWVSIDGMPATRIDLQDRNLAPTDGGPATVASRIMAVTGRLDPTVEHTVTFSTRPNEGYLVLDMLMYTAVDPVKASTSEPNPTLIPAPSDFTTPSTINSNRIRTIHIAAGIVAALLTLLCIPIVFWCCKRRRRRAREDREKFLIDAPLVLSPSDSGGSAPLGVHHNPIPSASFATTSPPQAVFFRDLHGSASFPPPTRHYQPPPVTRRPGHNTRYGSTDALLWDHQRQGSDNSLSYGAPLRAQTYPIPTPAGGDHVRPQRTLIIANSTAEEPSASTVPSGPRPAGYGHRNQRQPSADSSTGTSNGSVSLSTGSGGSISTIPKGLKPLILASSSTLNVNKNPAPSVAPPYRDRATMPPAYPGHPSPPSSTRDLPPVPSQAPQASTSTAKPPAESSSSSSSSSSSPPSSSPSSEHRRKRGKRVKRKVEDIMSDVRKAAEGRNVGNPRRVGTSALGGTEGNDARTTSQSNPDRPRTRIGTLYNPWDKPEEDGPRRSLDGVTLVGSAPTRRGSLFKPPVEVLAPPRG